MRKLSWSLFARLGRRFVRLRSRPATALPPDDEIPPDFTKEELAEFLEGDAHPNDARPEFRDQLREELWELLRKKQLDEKGP